MQNLCQLGDLKAWLAIPATQTSEDALLSRLIGAVSADFLAAISRPDLTPAADYTEIRNGNDKASMILRHWPINSIASVTIGTTVIPASADGIADGFWFDANTDLEYRFKLIVNNYKFTLGSTVTIVYNAGYANIAIANELANIPASTPFTIAVAKASDFLSDTSVVFVVAGTTLTKVTANPAAGQYSVSDQGVYTFAAADAGKAVRISYSTFGCPADIRQAVIDWTALRYKGRQWIGQISKHIQSGETVSFQNVLMPETTKACIESYRKVLLVMRHD